MWIIAVRRWVIVVALALGVFAATETASAVPVANKVKPPSVSFQVTPSFIACRENEAPHLVTTGWRVIHGVSKVTITGAVAHRGEAPKPVVFVFNPPRRSAHGVTKVFVLCDASGKTLTLTATGPGGTSTMTASIGEAAV